MELNQITLKSTNIARTIDFFSALNVELIVVRDFYVRMMIPGSTKASLSFELSASKPNNDTLIHFEVNDVDQTVKELKAKGITFHANPETKPYHWREARFYDPDGNEFCIFNAGTHRLEPLNKYKT